MPVPYSLVLATLVWKGSQYRMKSDNRLTIPMDAVMKFRALKISKLGRRCSAKKGLDNWLMSGSKVSKNGLQLLQVHVAKHVSSCHCSICERVLIKRLKFSSHSLKFPLTRPANGVIVTETPKGNFCCGERKRPVNHWAPLSILSAISCATHVAHHEKLQSCDHLFQASSHLGILHPPSLRHLCRS